MHESKHNMCSLWSAPTCERINARITLPSSKSLTNRYLVLAALSTKSTQIMQPLLARDTTLMMKALQKMGTHIVGDAKQLTVTPGILQGAHIDAGLAGTVLRFLSPLSALATGNTIITADPPALRRPILPLVEALTKLGIDISTTCASLPLKIAGTGNVQGGYIELDASASSQFISGLMLSAPKFQHGLEIKHVGNPLPSKPHIHMTLTALQLAGVACQTLGSDHWFIPPTSIDLPNVQVEPDLSNAGPFLAAAMVTAGTIQIDNWVDNPHQPGSQFLTIFTQMGASTHFKATNQNFKQCSLTGPLGITPIDLDCRNIGELVPTLAAVCAFARGSSYLHNVSHLRGHETDRLQAICTELAKINISTELSAHDLTIHGNPSPLPNLTDEIVIDSYHDHRMATFGAILGLKIPHLKVANIETTYKTLPNFPQLWKAVINE